MMRKTNKEIAEFYGVKVGDIVRVYRNRYDTDGGVYDEYTVITDVDGDIVLHNKLGYSFELLYGISIKRYEVFKPKKKRGDLFKCKDFKKCSDGCPLKGLSCNLGLVECSEDSLYEILEKTCSYYGFDTDHPIYKAFKAELDKEVE